MSNDKTIAYLFNPQNLAPQELINNFVIRKKEFNLLYNEITHSNFTRPGQHYLVQGIRGSGKTTLLRRLYYEFKDNYTSGKSNLIPVLFREEEYSIRSLALLWEKTLEYLEEYDEFKGVYEEVERQSHSHDDGKKIFSFLEKTLQKHKKKLILFVENIGDILNRFSETEHREFRVILMTSPELRFVGATANDLEATYRYDQPLYEFFKNISLEGLNREETNELLLKLSKNRNENEVQKIVQEQPQRVEVLRRLTGGVPRTIVLLFEVFVDDTTGNSVRDLDLILDRITPLYKAKMDELSSQQQSIVDVIALNWDAISTKEIAAKLRMESKAVSAQLSQLEKNRVIEKEQTKTKNHLYRIQERFFNIWYLMRYGRRGERQKVIWFVRFLESWCSREDLITKSMKLIASLAKSEYNPKYVYYMTESLSQTGQLPVELENKLLDEAYLFLSSKDEDLASQLSPSERKIVAQVTEKSDRGDWEGVIDSLTKLKQKDSIICGVLGLAYYNTKNFKEAVFWLTESAKTGDIISINMLGMVLILQKEFNSAIKWLTKGYEKGIVESMVYLGHAYSGLQDYTTAAQYYLEATDNGSIEAMTELALVYRNINATNDAIRWFTKAANRGNERAMVHLGQMSLERKDTEKAEKWFLKASKKGSSTAKYFLALIYLISARDKDLALSYIRDVNDNKHNLNVLPEFLISMTFYTIQLWNNNFNVAMPQGLELIKTNPVGYEEDLSIHYFICLSIAKKQYHSLLNFFKESDYIEREKPLYYALMYFMQDEYPNEYLKMGDELKETVKEVIQKIKKYELQYA